MQAHVVQTIAGTTYGQTAPSHRHWTFSFVRKVHGPFNELSCDIQPWNGIRWKKRYTRRRIHALKQQRGSSTCSMGFPPQSQTARQTAMHITNKEYTSGVHVTTNLLSPCVSPVSPWGRSHTGHADELLPLAPLVYLHFNQQVSANNWANGRVQVLAEHTSRTLCVICCKRLLCVLHTGLLSRDQLLAFPQSSMGNIGAIAMHS